MAMFIIVLMITSPLLSRGELIDLTFNLDSQSLYYPGGQKPFSMDIFLQGDEFHGIWIQSENFETGIHVSTHMDAPRHVSEGGRTVDQIPVKDFIAPAVVIDIRAKASKSRDTGILLSDVQAWETSYGQIPDGAVILQCSGWTERYPNRESVYGPETDDNTTTYHFPSFEIDAVQWLVNNRKIVGLGVDTPSIDVGNTTTFPVHIFALGREMYGLENMKDTCMVPPSGATLYTMPVKITGASGAPIRVFATWDTEASQATSPRITAMGLLVTAMVAFWCMFVY